MRCDHRALRGNPVRDDPDLDSAMDAMPAEDLRAFVRDALDRLDHEPRSELVDRLIARAAKSSSGWRPSSPSSAIVGEVKQFAEAARRVGRAEPHDVNFYLRQGSKAFLAGEYATAREVFAALFPPLADGDIYLGQHEVVDEVLTVNEQECAAQYIVSVYTTTLLEDRANTISEAIDAVHGIALFWSPLEQMERVATGPLPDLDAFLPEWVKYLEEQPASESEWDDDRSRWLREAVLRLEGVEGLERVARRTKKPEALRAWCKALAEKKEWDKALRAFDVAAKMVGTSHWRGDYLDGAAVAVQELGRRDATRRLQSAWLGAPSLVRLLRWLGAGDPSASTLVKRAKQAILRSPTNSGRQMGVLYLLTGDLQKAAMLLSKAPGLGWSRDDHPGHILFPALAGLLAHGAKAALSMEVHAGLREIPRDPLDWDDGDREESTFTILSIADLIAVAGPRTNVGSKSLTTLLDAMRSAATKRVERILGNKRRRHYGHAATLVACCVELAPLAARQQSISRWLQGLRKKYSRFYAFQEELTAAPRSISS